MFDEFDIVHLLRMMAGVGCVLYVGIYTLLSWRAIRGDSLAFFVGNSVAATLVLASNAIGFDPVWFLLQILFIASGMIVMIDRFFAAQEADHRD